MPRRSGGGGMRSSPSRVPAPVRPAPPPAHPPAPQPKQPGLFGQMAATAGGVAIGSTVGHVVGHALVGGGSGAAHAATDQAAPAETQQQQYSNPCAQQMQAFLECANKNANDLSLCYGFNEALKECKAQFNV